MNAFQKRITLRVLGVHAAIIFLVAIVPLMRGCFKPKPKEIVTIVVIADAPSPVSIQSVNGMSDPEPPLPKVDTIPEPVKPKPVPTPKPKPKPKPTEPKKPKWKPTKVDPTKSKRIEATPNKPAVSLKDIEKALSGITSPSAQTSGSPSQFNAYDAQVFRIFYGKWARPGVPGARPAIVRITLLKNGRITGRVLKQKSGDPSFDQTVMDAVKSVSTLPKPPPGYPDSFDVRFSIVD